MSLLFKEFTKGNFFAWCIQSYLLPGEAKETLLQSTQNLRLRFKLWQIAFEKYGIVLSGSFKNILIIASTFISVIPCYPWIRVQTSLPVSRYFRIQFLLTQFSTRFPSTRYFWIQFSSTQFQSFSLNNEIAKAHMIEFLVQ